MRRRRLPHQYPIAALPIGVGVFLLACGALYALRVDVDASANLDDSVFSDSLRAPHPDHLTDGLIASAPGCDVAITGWVAVAVDGPQGRSVPRGLVVVRATAPRAPPGPVSVLL